MSSRSSAAVRVERSVRLPLAPELVWPLLADTDRVNRLLSLPPVQYRFERLGPGEARALARARIMGLTFEWEEKSFEWFRPRAFAVERVFRGGPIARIELGATLEPDGEGTNARIFGELTPRWVVFRPLLRWFAVRQVERLVRVARRLVELAPAPGHALPEERAPIDAQALGAAETRAAHGADADQRDVLRRLAEDLALLPDREVVLMRPFAWADARGVPRMRALEVFLRATRAGLLDMEWSLLCPHCHGRPSGRARLADLPAEAACDACSERFAIELDRAVEARFTVAARLRRPRVEVYCRGGPMNTPFVLARCRVAPRSTRELAAPLPVGSWRLAAAGGSALLRVSAGAGAVRVELPPGNEPREVGALGRVTLANATDREITLSVEAASVEDRAALAAIVGTLPLYQDLFAADVLAPGQQVAVRRLAVLFSDLKGSTALYRRIGDAKAYALVREHFAIFGEVLAAHDGVLVKTIGDSVMAVFTRARDALAAARDGHARMPAPIVLKVGVHAGPLLAVAANGRNDYFGTVVNVAARLKELAAPGETVVSAEVAEETGTAGARELVELRGIDGPLEIQRI